MNVGPTPSPGHVVWGQAASSAAAPRNGFGLTLGPSAGVHSAPPLGFSIIHPPPGPLHAHSSQHNIPAVPGGLAFQQHNMGMGYMTHMRPAAPHAGMVPQGSYANATYPVHLSALAHQIPAPLGM